ncbi:MAG: class I SAM-dependent methyltransferase [Chitinophagales bacterium]|nr:class I SAM-dependent methyltransferase [Chitinophagales bacterium]
MNIVQIVGNINELQLKDEEFDFIFSVNVLEHINKEHLPEIAKTLFRILKKGGLEYHSFGSYDHFYHIDKSISKFNYLRYSETQWKIIDNGIQPQNRMRIDYFEDLFKTVGFNIEKELHSSPNIEELKKVEVHEDFAHLPVEILAVDYGAFLLKKE